MEGGQISADLRAQLIGHKGGSGSRSVTEGAETTERASNTETRSKRHTKDMSAIRTVTVGCRRAPVKRGGGKAEGRRAKRVKRMGVGPHAH